MTEYRVGEPGATVFDAEGRLLAYLKPGSVIVPGTIDTTTAPREPGQQYPVRRRDPPVYDDKVIRPELER